MNNEQNVSTKTLAQIAASETLPPIFVGQVLYRNRLSRYAANEIQEVVVSKVGKKYFYLTGWEEKRYPINKVSLQYNNKIYSQSDFQLYRDKQEIFDRTEKSDLLNKLQKHFNSFANGSRNTLDQLRKAVDVLGLQMGKL